MTDAIGDWIEKTATHSEAAPAEFLRIDWLEPNPQLAAYRPLGIDGGIARSLQNMAALATLLSKHGIPLTIVVYPWPAQLAHNEDDNAQIAMWREFCRGRCKTFVNLYPAFYREQTITGTWYKKLFIPGDVHYSEIGNELVFRAVAPKILDDARQN